MGARGDFVDEQLLFSVFVLDYEKFYREYAAIIEFGGEALGDVLCLCSELLGNSCRGDTDVKDTVFMAIFCDGEGGDCAPSPRASTTDTSSLSGSNCSNTQGTARHDKKVSRRASKLETRAWPLPS